VATAPAHHAIDQSRQRFVTPHSPTRPSR
jgi:hypothetical protein